MSTALRDKIRNAVETALKGGDKSRLGVLRLINAAIKQYEVDNRKDAVDETVISILDKMTRDLREANKQFEAGKRDDLIQKNNFEITIIQEFLPAPLSEEALASLIDETLAAVGAQSIKDMGKVMGVLKPKVLGKTDMGALGDLIKKRLAEQ